ncbi:hypothetical protein QLQ15_15955 [Lysobacter sp. LF1]|uniref:Serine/threonine protein kinase n=1 Tax=Lysobacter stagni TaxID=3045172 RepID=A0ABT6XJP7_9GAMM|nr:hypothetical protein [Lysobacter sp. LF1]MDI9240401.1 hypothetical protein [Lysobacter sp. LF1]
MDNDELKAAWQAMETQLAEQGRVQMELVREKKLDRTRGLLRPLFWGQVLQVLLGVGLIVLGVACWKQNLGVAGLFAVGVVVHAFGVVTLVAAAITLGLMARIDYTAPVLRIQTQMAQLQRFHTLNGIACGLPWWVAWVLVVVAFAGAGRPLSSGPTPAWIAWSLAVGVVGMLGTWLLHYLAQRAPDSRLARFMRDTAAASSLRRAQAALDDVRRFGSD